MLTGWSITTCGHGARPARVRCQSGPIRALTPASRSVIVHRATSPASMSGTRRGLIVGFVMRATVDVSTRKWALRPMQRGAGSFQRMKRV